MTLFFTINTCSPDRLTEVDKGRDREKNKEKCVKKRKKYNVRKEKEIRMNVFGTNDVML